MRLAELTRLIEGRVVILNIWTRTRWGGGGTGDNIVISGRGGGGEIYFLTGMGGGGRVTG